jgi:hypothetical protein
MAACLAGVAEVSASGPGAPSTLLVRGLNENGTEVDRFTLVR